MALLTSILASVKDYCMVPQEADIYDGQLLEQINSAFFTLFQLGCSKTPFVVTSEEATWDDFINSDGASSSASYISSVLADYVQKRVRLGFDPPSNSFLVTQLKEDIEKLESRISYTVDPGWEDIDE